MASSSSAQVVTRSVSQSSQPKACGSSVQFRFQALETEPLNLSRDEFARMMQGEEMRWADVLQRLGVGASN